MADQEAADFIFHHVILPPRLPEKDDSEISNERALVSQLEQSLSKFAAHVEGDGLTRVTSCIRMCRASLDVQFGDQDLSASLLEDHLLNMANGDVLPLYIRKQNAGLVIRKSDEKFIFETMELMASAEEVMKCKGRLRRCFPGPVSSVPSSTVLDPNFCKYLAFFIFTRTENSTWDQEISASFRVGEKRKAGGTEPVSDTVPPGHITEMLTSILRGIGEAETIDRIWKNTRDDILAAPGSKSVWRRSPLWTLFRVALQTTLQTSGESRSFLYKSFMVSLHADILHIACNTNSQGEKTFLIAQKTERRLYKLKSHDLSAARWAADTASLICTARRRLAEERQSLNEKNLLSAFEELSSKFAETRNQDACFDLTTYREYQASRVNATANSDSQTQSLHHKFPKRLDTASSTFPDANLLSHGSPLSSRLAMYDFESWIDSHLQAHVEAILTNVAGASQHHWKKSLVQACETLSRLGIQYHNLGCRFYEGSPRDCSLLILVLTEIWVAIDRLTISRHKLLAQYSPELSTDSIKDLLLLSSKERSRARAIENYIIMRKANMEQGRPSLFSNTPGSDSFSIQYYNTAQPMKDFHKRTLQAADERHQKYKQQLLEKQQQCLQTLNHTSQMAHDVDITPLANSVGQHARNCTKCNLEKEVARSSIVIEEQPLPREDYTAKNVIFEAHIPPAISVWRDFTLLLLSGFSKRSQIGNGYLSHADGLRTLVTFNKLPLSNRKVYLSVTRHSKAQSTILVQGASEEDLYLANGCNFRLIFSSNNQPVEDCTGPIDIKSFVTFSIPHEGMQKSLQSTHHTPNESIAASVKDCPEGWTCHESNTFFTLRSGCQLQWRNLVLCLAHSLLDFNSEEVHLLIAQTIWETGAPSMSIDLPRIQIPSPDETTPPQTNTLDYIRQSQIDILDENFCMTAIRHLDKRARDIESNWEAATAMRSFIIICQAILTASPSQEVQKQCIELLRLWKEIIFKWLGKIDDLLNNSDASKSKELKDMSLEVALSGEMALMVDKDHIPSLLETAVDVGMQCRFAMTIRERAPTDTRSMPPVIRLLMMGHWRLSQRLEPLLRRSWLDDGYSLNENVTSTYNKFTPVNTWEQCERPNDRLLRTRSADGEVLEYNVLEGTLLVNGKQFSRLPSHFEAHHTYKRLFSDRVFLVASSSTEGMEYETTTSFHGYMLRFSMFRNELMIQAECEESAELFELVPQRVLEPLFPQAFISKFVLWLNQETNILEFRPVENPWKASSTNWKMNMSAEFGYVVASTLQLIRKGSPIFQDIAAIFSRLETEEQLYCYFENDHIKVVLARYQLTFCFTTDQFESEDFQGMVIDENQHIQTLSGLQSRLVLRTKLGYDRLVLVPEGKVKLPSSDNGNERTWIQIDTEGKDLVRYHTFDINVLLGRLDDNASLHARLFRAYLHAVTSHFLTDDLMGRTGTEEALSILQGASVATPCKIDNEEIEILIEIAKLSPQRRESDHGHAGGQSVSWSGLLSLAQSEEFGLLVSKIVTHDKYNKLFDTDWKIKSGMCGNAHLAERGLLRNQNFRVLGAGEENKAYEHDTTYTERNNLITNDDRCKVINSATKSLALWTSNLPARKEMLNEMLSWGHEILPYVPVPSVLPLPTQEDLDLGIFYQPTECRTSFLAKNWCSMDAAFSKATQARDRFNLMFAVGSIVYTYDIDIELTNSIVLLATSSIVRQLQAPRDARCQGYNLKKGSEPDATKIEEACKKRLIQFAASPENTIPAIAGERAQDLRKRRLSAWRDQKEKVLGRLVTFFMSQWPTQNPIAPNQGRICRYFKIQKVMDDMKDLFQTWHRNRICQEYIRQLSAAYQRSSNVSSDDFFYDLNDIYVDHLDQRPEFDFISPPGFVTFKNLLENTPPEIHALPMDDFSEWLSPASTSETMQVEQLNHLINRLSHEATSRLEEKYVRRLEESRSATLEEALPTLAFSIEDLKLSLHHALFVHEEHVNRAFDSIRSSLCLVTTEMLSFHNLTPRITPIVLLGLLATRSKQQEIPPQWQDCILEYAICILRFQKVRRLCRYTSHADIVAELLNPGHGGWNPKDNPDWILFEIENDLLIRADQVEVAKQMIDPISGGNTVMQLAMGRGKSSVIVPLVAAALADRTRLVRVYVLKSLTPHMVEVLSQKLGGFLDRPIYYMPISRSMKVTSERFRKIKETYEACMRQGGILIIEPEHEQSLILLGISYIVENIDSTSVKAGNQIMDLALWLNSVTRDIIDESDEVFNARSEVCYTLGLQKNIDFSPDRWSLVAAVLQLVFSKAIEWRGDLEQGLEIIETNPNALSRLRVLDTAEGISFRERLVRHICSNGLPGLPVHNCSQAVKTKICEFIMGDERGSQYMREHNDLSENMRSGVLLVKGLFNDGVLQFVLGQRWRIRYGLALKRCGLAVPYSAKDTPSARSEFSQPEVTIAFTLLAYYYTGLTDSQIKQCFQLLTQGEDAQAQYESWIQFGQNVPENLRTLSSVNFADTSVSESKLFPILRFSPSLINYYLFRTVFPREMREYPYKISASGWDIGRRKTHPTTGFSGTNETQDVLPLWVEQSNPRAQIGTDASILKRIFHPSNSFLDAQVELETTTLNSEGILKLIAPEHREISVVLDAGGLIMDADNEEFARNWLATTHLNVEAAVYIGHNNDVRVVTRDGKSQLLINSVFNMKMDKCLFYLDEAHTRGVDLKIPHYYKALLTLGTGLTKDRLTQAAMRMRKLGFGQSLVFCCSADISQQIRHSTERIEVLDILNWAAKQTWAASRRDVCLWALQGKRYISQKHHLDALDYGDLKEHDLCDLKEIEAKTICERYGPTTNELAGSWVLSGLPDNVGRSDEIREIQARCNDAGIKTISTSSVHEEQERELAPESEREEHREVNDEADPRSHRLHEDIKKAVEEGFLRGNPGGVRALCEAFSETTAVEHYEAGVWPRDVLASEDFVHTVTLSQSGKQNDYIRIPQWILSFRRKRVDCDEPGDDDNTRQFVVISPFEAQQLKSLIQRGDKGVILHCYAPRTRRSAQTLEDLDFCAVPGVPTGWKAPGLVTILLSLFSGQLYLRDFGMYKIMCIFLGLRSNPEDSELDTGFDGFVTMTSRENNPSHPIVQRMRRFSPFTRTPIPFLREVYNICRKGQDFSSSHMGRIFNGEVLTEEHFRNMAQDNEQDEEMPDVEQPEEARAPSVEDHGSMDRDTHMDEHNDIKAEDIKSEEVSVEKNQSCEIPCARWARVKDERDDENHMFVAEDMDPM